MTLKELFQNGEHKWNAIYSVFYAVLIFVLAGAVWLVDEKFPKSISVFDLVLLSLATFRLIRLFVYDAVTLFIREYVANAQGGAGHLKHILGCPWCFGVWAGTLVVFFYYVMPMAWFVFLILAISGVASFIQVLINMIGWKAELGKMEAQSKK